MRRLPTPAAALIGLMVAACGLGGTPPASTSPDPSGDEFDPQGAWQLESGTADGIDIPIVDGHPITVVIDGTQIGGTAACNQYGGRLTVSGGRLTISDLGMTAMGCVDAGVMESEAAYTAALGRVQSIGDEDGQLVLSGPAVEMRFERLPEPPTAEVVDTAWVLETLFVGDVASAPMGERATLKLHADGTLEGSTGCRTFSGEWQERGEQIFAPTFGMDQTECPADLSGQDSHVVSVIGDGFVPSIEGDLLTLTDPGGVGLVYRAEH